MTAAFSSRRHRLLTQLSTALFWVVHFSVLLVFVVPFHWKLVGLAAGGYLLRMWAITAGYHRYFSHRSYRTSRVFQFGLAWLGASAMQNGPLWWASWHRRHHRFADTTEDAHSPAHGGFWHAHAGWFLDGSHDEPDFSNVGDLARYPELRFVERRKWLPIVSYTLVCWAIAGVGGVVWGFLLSTVAVLHMTMLINSLAHVHGSRRYATRDDSRNNPWLAVLTLGEGWHNNHHRCMTSARQGFFWWEIDITYWTLCVLASVGIVWNLRRPPQHILTSTVPSIAPRRQLGEEPAERGRQ
jgi:stearoyl-CoA desaturase (delta-9 desaturase)